MTDKVNGNNEVTTEQATSESRRAFLKKAGVFALYAPPAITLLTNPSHASVMNSPGGNHDRDGYFSRSHNNRHSSRSRDNRDSSRSHGGSKHSSDSDDDNDSHSSRTRDRKNRH